MRLIFAVSAIVGIAVVTHAGPIGETATSYLTFGPEDLKSGDYPFELYPVPPRENRSLANYAAVSYLILNDEAMYSKKLKKYLLDWTLNKTSEIDGLLSNWLNVLENALSYNYETVEQLKSEVGRGDYDTALYTSLVIQMKTDKIRRDNLLTNLRNLFHNGSNKTLIRSQVEDYYDKANDKLLQRNYNIAKLIKGSGINPFYFHRDQLERFFVGSMFNVFGFVVPRQIVEEAVDEYIREHGYYMPVYRNLIERA